LNTLKTKEERDKENELEVGKVEFGEMKKAR
jgi:hypothetical protein